MRSQSSHEIEKKMLYSVNQLLFVCEKYSRDSRETLRCKCFSPETCLCGIGMKENKTWS